MRLVTHTATAVALALLYVRYVTPVCVNDVISIGIYFVMVYLSNVALDLYGHSWVVVGGVRFPKRNRLHSPLGITLLALLFSVPLLVGQCPLLTGGVFLGLFLHLIEDMVTEGGIYGLGKKRVKAPVTLSYDSTVLNRLADIVFIALILLLSSDFMESLIWEALIVGTVLYLVLATLSV